MFCFNLSEFLRKCIYNKSGNYLSINKGGLNVKSAPIIDDSITDLKFCFFIATEKN